MQRKCRQLQMKIKEHGELKLVLPRENIKVDSLIKNADRFLDQ